MGGRKLNVGFFADVTERSRAEQSLRESERRYRLLFERNLAGVLSSRVENFHQTPRD